MWFLANVDVQKAAAFYVHGTLVNMFRLLSQEIYVPLYGKDAAPKDIEKLMLEQGLVSPLEFAYKHLHSPYARCPDDLAATWDPAAESLRKVLQD